MLLFMQTVVCILLWCNYLFHLENCLNFILHCTLNVIMSIQYQMLWWYKGKAKICNKWPSVKHSWVILLWQVMIVTTNTGKFCWLIVYKKDAFDWSITEVHFSPQPCLHRNCTERGFHAETCSKVHRSVCAGFELSLQQEKGRTRWGNQSPTQTCFLERKPSLTEDVEASNCPRIFSSCLSAPRVSWCGVEGRGSPLQVNTGACTLLVDPHAESVLGRTIAGSIVTRSITWQVQSW